MITIDQLIARLTEIRNAQNIPPDQQGKTEVMVRCPVANIDCWLSWLSPDNIHETGDGPLILIQGGIRA